MTPTPGERAFDGPVLITGGAGFIGSNLADALLSDGEDTTSMLEFEGPDGILELVKRSDAVIYAVGLRPPQEGRGNTFKRSEFVLRQLAQQTGGRVFFLRTDDIEWVEAAGNYVRLHLANDSHLFRETMNNMEARLDGQRFVRIHRSILVRRDRIARVRPQDVVLIDGTQLKVGKRYRADLAA